LTDYKDAKKEEAEIEDLDELDFAEE